MLTPYLLFFYRARCIDSHNVPAEGPVIIAPNHFSFLDHFFVAVYLRRKVHFMAKSQLFKRPMQFIYTHGGVFPVRRGHHDEEAFKTAARHPRARRHRRDVRRGRPLAHRRARASRATGIGRLALESGAPVVPTAIAGTERARNWKRLQFPKVTVQFGEPLQFEQVRRADARSRPRRPRRSSSPASATSTRTWSARAARERYAAPATRAEPPMNTPRRRAAARSTQGAARG